MKLTITIAINRFVSSVNFRNRADKALTEKSSERRALASIYGTFSGFDILSQVLIHFLRFWHTSSGFCKHSHTFSVLSSLNQIIQKALTLLLSWNRSKTSFVLNTFHSVAFRIPHFQVSLKYLLAVFIISHIQLLFKNTSYFFIPLIWLL